MPLIVRVRERVREQTPNDLDLLKHGDKRIRKERERERERERVKKLISCYKESFSDFAQITSYLSYTYFHLLKVFVSFVSEKKKAVFCTKSFLIYHDLASYSLNLKPTNLAPSEKKKKNTYKP